MMNKAFVYFVAILVNMGIMTILLGSVINANNKELLNKIDQSCEVKNDRNNN